MARPSSFINRLACRLSLANGAGAWFQEAVADSLVLRPFIALGTASREKLRGLSGLGNILQSLAYALAIIMLFSFGLPRFANDKSGLAIMALAGLGLWCLGWLAGGKQKRVPDAMDYLVLLYLGANIIATFASHYFVPSLKGLAKAGVFISSYFYFTALMSGDSRKKQLGLFGTALLTALALSIHGLYQYKIGVAPLATWEDPTLESHATRIYSTLGNPNLLAGFLLPSVPIALGFTAWLASKRRWLLALPVLAIAGLISLACILTESRGCYLGLFAAFLFFGGATAIKLWLIKPRLRGLIVGLALTGVLAGGVGLTRIPNFSQRVETMFSLEHSSNAYRYKVYRSSFDMFKDNWWFGTGPGNETFVRAYGLYMVSSFDALGTYSVPLEVAVESGLPGLLSFGALIICLLGRAHRIFWLNEPGESASGRIWLVLGLAAAIAGLMVHGLVDTVFYRPQIQFQFWLIVAGLVVGIRSEKEERLNETKINAG
ncbi:MAG: O-antigen ligase family protein [Candidatus Obscuribacterales bacterium]